MRLIWQMVFCVGFAALIELVAGRPGGVSSVSFSIYTKQKPHKKYFGNAKEKTSVAYEVKHPGSSSYSFSDLKVKEHGAYGPTKKLVHVDKPDEKWRIKSGFTEERPKPQPESNPQIVMPQSRPPFESPIMLQAPVIHKSPANNRPYQLTMMDQKGQQPEQMQNQGELGFNLAEALDESVPIRFY